MTEEDIDPLDQLVAKLAAYVNTDATSEADYLKRCVTDAQEMVERAIGGATVPDTIRERAVIECGSEFFHRRNAPSGMTQQFLGADGTPNRLARDPMTGARELLKPFLPLGFA